MTDIWVMGVAMTRFGRYPDLDDVDLAFEAASGALADADVAMADVGVLAAGSLLNRPGSANRCRSNSASTAFPFTT